MKNTHTPGPWLRTKSGNRLSSAFQIVAGADGNGDPNTLVATIHPIGIPFDPEPCEETKANARLIAAAPELLSACQAFLELFKSGGNSERLNPYLRPEVKAAIAAIAKVKGGEK
jgi:hypothetical protein